MHPVWVRRFAVITCLAAVLVIHAGKARAQDVDIAGAFAIDHNASWTGDQIALTMTIELRNEGSRAAHQVVVTLSTAEPEDWTQLAGDAILFSFQPVEVVAGDTARVKATFVLAGNQWRMWQSGGGPIFWISGIDDEARSVGKRLLLAHVTSIADPDAAN